MFRIDRDILIFLALILSVVLLKFLPFSAAVKLPIFVLIVILQALFVYHGLTRHRR